MHRATPLPPELSRKAFHVSDGRADGLTPKRLRSADLVAPFRGVRISAEAVGFPELSYAPLLREGDRFSHTTAARLWGAPLPRRVAGEIHVTSGIGGSKPRASGVIGHESSGVGSVLRNGLPVSDPVTCFHELATWLTGPELVAVGDYLVLDPRVLDPYDVRPHLSLGSLRTSLGASAGRGVRAARAAAALVREGSESPKETALRLLLVCNGIPEPVCGYELIDDAGRGVGWFDLAWPEYRVIAEYDGDGHRTSTEQYEKDIRRFDRAAAIDWRVIRVRRHGIQVDRTETVRRVGTALARGGWTPNSLYRSFALL